MRANFVICLVSLALAGGSIGGPIDVIRAVGLEGDGNVEAAAAWRELADSEASELLPILRGMRGANPLAANWLRSAVDTISDREGAELPVAELGEFLLDTRQNPRARRLAFELIAKADPPAAEALVPGMLADPSQELRRDAVARLIGQAETLAKAENTAGATLIYRQALGAARDIDQVKLLAERLRELGREVDLPEHFGFLMRWKAIAPFDNSGREGFDVVYPPEEQIDLAETYDGKGKKVQWQPLETGHEFGIVDFNKPFGMVKEAVGYAYTTFESTSARPVELRLGCKNAWKVWLNGELLFGRDEYHRGMRIDQYRIPAQLKAGKNEILIKLCQNEQTEEWTVQWEFQLRVCDSSGTAVLSSGRLPTPVASGGRRPGRRANKDESK
ncbi:MAG: hypothetical protein ACR2RV_21925 [Verrucomicrobiales bacterium]